MLYSILLRNATLINRKKKKKQKPPPPPPKKNQNKTKNNKNPKQTKFKPTQNQLPLVRFQMFDLHNYTDINDF